MPIPRFNYYPPAGEVIDQTDPRVTWNGRAWMANGRVYGVPSTHRLIGRPGSSHNGWFYDWGRRAWMEPAPAPTPPRPVSPQPQPQPPRQLPVPRAPEKKECQLEKKPENILESLIKHPVAPVLGGVLLLAAHFTDEPQPPAIPVDLPEALQKQWQMIFNQNQQRFQRRMEMYENLGNVLLGYASTQTVLAALPPKKSA
jgi:hypothetical protein